MTTQYKWFVHRQKYFKAKNTQNWLGSYKTFSIKTTGIWSHCAWLYIYISSCTSKFQVDFLSISLKCWTFLYWNLDLFLCHKVWFCEDTSTVLHELAGGTGTLYFVQWLVVFHFIIWQYYKVVISTNYSTIYSYYCFMAFCIYIYN